MSAVRKYAERGQWRRQLEAQKTVPRNRREEGMLLHLGCAARGTQSIVWIELEECEDESALADDDDSARGAAAAELIAAQQQLVAQLVRMAAQRRAYQVQLAEAKAAGGPIGASNPGTGDEPRHER